MCLASQILRLIPHASMPFFAACQLIPGSPDVRPATVEIAPEPWQDWAGWVQKRHSVGDEHGHGPDVGSMEWAHALHYQLKIADQSGDTLNIGSLGWRRAVEKALSGR